MNQRPTGLHVTKAITGFLQYKSAEGLSPVTISGYDRDQAGELFERGQDLHRVSSLVLGGR
jgi:hypothetical protein